MFGQELNDETYAICRSDMMLKGQDASHIVAGNSFSEDGHKGARFDYLLANPPFGVEWKNVEDEVKTEAATKGFAGRFGAGLPDIDDGAILFLQHMISKMKPSADGGSRVAVVKPSGIAVAATSVARRNDFIGGPGDDVRGRRASGSLPSSSTRKRRPGGTPNASCGPASRSSDSPAAIRSSPVTAMTARTISSSIVGE